MLMRLTACYIVDGSVYLVTIGVTLYKYIFHVMITKRKPFLYVFSTLSARPVCWRFQNGKHCKLLACG